MNKFLTVKSLYINDLQKSKGEVIRSPPAL